MTDIGTRALARAESVIEAQRARIAQLEAALQKIANYVDLDADDPVALDLADIASRALSADKPKER